MSALSPDRVCILFVTHQCNLNCVYCYEKFKNKHRMSAALARHLLAKEITEFQERESGGTLTISFLGGEPLLNFDLIRNTCEWLWHAHPFAPYEIELRTNGTCLTPESKAWFLKHKSHIRVGLSLDGTEDLQNLNRSGSGSRIPLDFFTDNWPDNEVNATISPAGLKLLAESAIFFHERSIPFRLTIAQDVEWGEGAPQIWDAQLGILVDYYLAHPETHPAKSLFYEDFCELRDNNGPREHSMCGSREEMVAYTAEGKKCICHLFTDITMGNPLFEQTRRPGFLPEIFPADPGCRNCPARPLCKVCPGFNLITTGNVATQDKRACGMKFAILRANCALYIRQHMQQAHCGQLTEQEFSNMTWALEHLESQPHTQNLPA